ncbi:MAG: hypothetical protein HZA49_05520 [Planctomycetes bacterium]|nr:hypothetical protein [Planctomycetota bacterium]
MKETMKIKLGLAIILSGAIILGYYGCGGSSSSSDSGSSAPLYSTGVLDTTFDTDGVVTTTIGSGGDYAQAIALQTDGKILVAGYAFNGLDNNIALARYNVNGSLDTAFDTDGVVITAIGSDDGYASAVAVQTDGKIVVAGYVSNGANNDFALARYTITGTLDTAFDTDGIVTTTIGSSNDYAYALALQADGKMVVAGNAWNGANDNFTLARYNTNGSLDTTFDTDGIVTTTIGSSDCYAQAITLQADGKILVAGYAYNGADNDFALARYTITGTLDTTFGISGVVTTTIGSSNDYAYALALQADGKIVVAGYVYNGVNYDFALARYWR